uniref:Chitin-binding type-2 domain-containing protein n=1 Tax=Parascaris univalens TaxID=6257 RepID=A0A915B1X5_PARUN
MKSAIASLLVGVVTFVGSVSNDPFPPYGVQSSSSGGDSFCLKRSDGVYSMGCISQFITCTRKISHIMFCGDQLFYDKRTEKCAPRWYASSCTDYSKERPQGIPSSFFPVAPEESKFCWGRANGDYSIGCVAYYITCSGGQAHAMECPAGLVLDETSKTCLGKAYVSVCGGAPTTTTPAPVITTPIPPLEAPAAELGPCVPHESRFFALGCSPRYLVCTDGRATYYTCPNGFTLHEQRRTCVSKVFDAFHIVVFFFTEVNAEFFHQKSFGGFSIDRAVDGESTAYDNVVNNSQELGGK